MAQNHSGTLKRTAPPLATFRATTASSSTSTASNSPTVASIPQPPLLRPGILKPPSTNLERSHEATTNLYSGNSIHFHFT